MPCACPDVARSSLEWSEDKELIRLCNETD